MTHSRRHGKLTAGVLRALGIFGSIEVVTMLCAVVRTKLVAIWIGAAGVGVISLYNTTMEMLRAIMHLNLRQSSVRQIAAAPLAERPLQCSGARRAGLLIGIVSAIITAALSPLLSRLTFGSSDYTVGFLLLSLTMAAASVSSTRAAVLQALGRLKPLARATAAAAIASTAAAIILFYFWRADAIVPVLMIFPLFTLLFLSLAKAGPDSRVADPDRRRLKTAMVTMIRLGGWLTVAAGITLMADYALRVYIMNVAGIDSVGLFQAGYTIVNTYIGVIFTAIAVEFFPRLSSTINRPMMTRTVVAHEIAVVTWLLLPVVIVFMAADRLAVTILYSEDFTGIIPYMSVAVTATTLRGASWCLAYVIISKGDGRAYVVTEAVSAIVLLCSAIPLWRVFGFVGLGLAYVIQYIVYTLVTAWTCRRYGMRLRRPTLWLICGAPAVAAVALVLKTTVGWWAPLLLLPPVLITAIRFLRH